MKSKFARLLVICLTSSVLQAHAGVGKYISLSQEQKESIERELVDGEAASAKSLTLMLASGPSECSGSKFEELEFFAYTMEQKLLSKYAFLINIEKPSAAVKDAIAVIEQHRSDSFLLRLTRVEIDFKKPSAQSLAVLQKLLERAFGRLEKFESTTNPDRRGIFSFVRQDYGNEEEENVFKVSLRIQKNRYVVSMNGDDFFFEADGQMVELVAKVKKEKGVSRISFSGSFRCSFI